MAILKDHAYNLIRGDILSCTLEPGSVVSENALCKRYGIGRTPVREAVNRLENDNLVRIHSKQGISIAGISIKDIKDLYILNEVLEPYAAQKAAGRIPEAVLREYVRFYRNSNNDLSDPASFRKNRDFHLLIASATQNPLFIQLLMDIHDQLMRARIYTRTIVNKDRARDHLDLIDALLRGDGNGAREISIRHIRNSQRSMIRLDND